MGLENAAIEISGMVASKDLMSHLENWIHWLEAVGPSTSTINVKLSATDKKVHGEVTICSPIQRFHAECDDQSLVEVMLQISKSIEDQISRWKRTRFSFGKSLILEEGSPVSRENHQ